MDPRVGAEFAGHRIERLIGRGGASVVYLAEHIRLGRRVALKILDPRLAHDQTFRQRFISEPRLVAALDHPNIVAVYDAGEVGDELYISMRYVAGPDLGSVLRTEGSLGGPRTISILEQIASALDAAHLAGLVHRDVKPANVLVETVGKSLERAYLADFGISKRLTSEAGPTRTGQFVGTVDYVAPEQIAGAPVDGRTDVYSLACVLYQCLSGRVPFPAEIEVATIYRHLNDPPPSSEGIPNIGNTLDEVLQRALAKKKEDRYETCRELIEEARIQLDVPGPLSSKRALFREQPGGDRPGVVGEPELDTSREVRKTVTVIFSDVAGSTAMGERLDPEALREVMSRYFQRMKVILESHGGTVEKFVGDAVMAVFGIPVIHEDDPLRACRAALEMRQELSRLNRELERDWNVTISSRTGVNTGEVIAGDPSSGQSFVTGDPVNTAARIEQAAAAGEILVGEGTYRSVRDSVHVEPAKPINAKGKAEPVAVYRLTSLTPTASPQPERRRSPMVGRQRELRTLRGALARARKERRCMLATIIGEPGIGKSRLASEFVNSLSGVRVLRGHCLSYGQGITFWPIAEAIRQAAGITEGDTVDDALARIDSLIPDAKSQTAIRDQVAAAMGLGHGEAAGEIQETFWAIRQLLEAVANDQGLLLLVDDIQWAEAALLDLFEYLEGWSSTSAMLVLCLARPELAEVRPEWTATAPNAEGVRLGRLSGDDSATMLENLIEPGLIRSDVAHHIIETAGGNPLFIEEMLGMLLDERQLQAEAGAMAVGLTSSALTPPSLEGLLSARIEALPSDERAVLQLASVVGQVFWWDAINHLSPVSLGAHVGACLQALVRRGLIQPDESELAGHDAFRFRHILIRDAAYRSLPRSRRAELHEGFAVWLERVLGDRTEEYEETLGYHLEQAASHLKGVASRREHAMELARDAASRLGKAGWKAATFGDSAAATALIERAMALLPERDSQRAWLLSDLHQAAAWADDLERASAIREQMEALARSLGDESLISLAEVHRVWSLYGHSPKSVSIDALRAAIERALVRSRLERREQLTSHLLDLLADLEWTVGGISEAIIRSEEGLVRAKEHGHLDSAAAKASLIVIMMEYGSTPVPVAIERARLLLETARARPTQHIDVLGELAVLQAMAADPAGALDSLSQTEAILSQLAGIEHMRAEFLWQSGAVASLTGDLTRAGKDYLTAWEYFSRVRQTANQLMLAWEWGRYLLEIGDDRAAAEVEAVLSSEAASYDAWAQITARGLRARIAARGGAIEKAISLSDEAYKMATASEFLNLRGDLALDRAEILSLSGQDQGSIAAAGEAVALYEAKGNMVGRALAKKWIGTAAAR